MAPEGSAPARRRRRPAGLSSPPPALRHAATSVLAVSLALAGLTAGDENSAWEWGDVPRVVAIGDIHGTHDKLVQLLQGSGVVDRRLRWIGGAAHLVAVGDLVDRNADDRAVLDLLRRLQADARAAGGRVHVLLGNHEVMNLVRDLRYVAPGSFASFADEERRSERRSARKRFLALHRGEDAAAVEARFQQRYPPGYFARLRAFDPDGEYGRWLLELPVIVKVNGVVFVHGGLTESVAGEGLDGINRRVLRELRYHLRQRQILERHGVVTPLLGFGELQDAAVAALQWRGGRGVTEAVRTAARGLLQLANHPLFGERGPLWYRGNALEDERIERGRLERALELLDAQAMVVAHSPTPDNTITYRFGRRLFRVDHGIYRGNAPLALIFEDGEPYVLDPSTRDRSRPDFDPPQGELALSVEEPIGDRELERFLTSSRVTDSRELGRGSTRPLLLELELNGVRRRGVFKSTEVEHRVDANGDVTVLDRYQHEVAAYLLDRRLGLGMVPVTVLRTVDERSGSLQAWVEGAIDRESAQAYQLQVLRADELERQLQRARVFDALIGNGDRTPTDILYVKSEGAVRLIDHSKAFPFSKDPIWTNGAPEQPPPELLAAITDLDTGWLHDALGRLLNERQIAALLERRDRLLAWYGGGPDPTLADRANEGSDR